MKIHRKIISLPSISLNKGKVKTSRGSQQGNRESKRSVEREQKINVKEKVLFHLIIRKPVKSQKKVSEGDEVELKKQRLQRIIYLTTKIGSSSRIRADEENNTQPHFVRYFRSLSKSRLQHSSDPSLVIKKKLIVPQLTNRFYR